MCRGLEEEIASGIDRIVIRMGASYLLSSRMDSKKNKIKSD